MKETHLSGLQRMIVFMVLAIEDKKITFFNSLFLISKQKPHSKNPGLGL